MYFIIIAPGLLLALWASWKTRSAFSRYSRVRSMTGLTGAQAAQRLLDGAGVSGVKIMATSGMLSDHYNPMTRTLALSREVYGSPSLAAIGVACHEAGHAIQHARHYAPMWLRSILVPTANVGSSIGYIVMVLGLFLSSANIVLFGAILFSMVLLFQIVTLPVEFDATSRAKRLAVEYGVVSNQERRGMDAVLNAAAMTYVAAVVSTILTLLYFLLRAGLLGGRDD
jgi:Zn-dependent membrane protease YugP